MTILAVLYTINAVLGFIGFAQAVHSYMRLVSVAQLSSVRDPERERGTATYRESPFLRVEPRHDLGNLAESVSQLDRAAPSPRARCLPLSGGVFEIKHREVNGYDER